MNTTTGTSTGGGLIARLRRVNNDNERGGRGGDWVACDSCASILYGDLRGKASVICDVCGGMTRLAGRDHRKIQKGGAR